MGMEMVSGLGLVLELKLSQELLLGAKRVIEALEVDMVLLESRH